MPSKINSLTGEAQLLDPYPIDTRGLSKFDAARVLTSTLNGLLDPDKRFNEPYIFEFLPQDKDVVQNTTVTPLVRPFDSSGVAPTTSKYNPPTPLIK